jgi:protein SCO1/2
MIAPRNLWRRGWMAILIIACTTMAWTLFPLSARAQDLLSPVPSTQLGVPPELEDVGFKPTLNGQVPLNLEFRDESGATVKLADFFHGKPVILALVYYQCPLLCNQELEGLVGSLKMLTFDAGKEFDVVVVSFDPRETAAMASAKKQGILARYRRADPDAGWHFLTGQSSAIEPLANSVGFHYVWDKPSGMWAHASGILLLTPQGRISRYFYGIEYSPRDVRLGLIEASDNKIGTPIDQALLFCYHYDPASGKYGVLVQRMLRIGGLLTILGIGGIILLCVRRTRQIHDVGATRA